MAWSKVVTFTDPLSCQAAILSADVEILPTSKESFQVEITQVGADRLWTQHFRISSPQVCTLAYKPGRQSIDFLTEANSSALQHCGVEVLPGDIIVSALDVAHRRSGANLDYGSMSLPIDELHTAFASIMGSDFVRTAGQPVIRPRPELMSRLLRLHKVVGQLAHDTPDILRLPEVLRALEDELVHMMTRCLAESVVVETSIGDRRHRAIINRFEEFLAANPDRPLYLTEICAAIGAAERTLRAACAEHVGMGPIRFLTLRRMHLARRALLQSDPTKSTVTGVVTNHGFWELGRFSVCYRSLFGESPSETLRRDAPESELHANDPFAFPPHLMAANLERDRAVGRRRSFSSDQATAMRGGDR
jgi:AraC-like DNA-binding protein